MTTEPKLYTETEARSDWRAMTTEGDFVQALRERGLIAEEPVDPLLAEAAKVCADYFHATGQYEVVKGYLPGGQYYGDQNDDGITLTLAALRRGMELAPRKELTREMVREAVDRATDVCNDSRWDDNFARFLHAALTEALQ